MRAAGDNDTPPVAGLTAALAREGLHVVLPVSQADLDLRSVPVRLDALLPGALSAVLIADGGRDFFQRFCDARSSHHPDPLDAFTTGVVTAVVRDAFVDTGIAHRTIFPFMAMRPLLPFARIGEAAGLGPPGPFGLQIHPVFGPWWAYRALIVLAAPWKAKPLSGAGCEGCDAPCVSVCPAQAVQVHGFRLQLCVAHRLAAAECRLSCSARLHCVRGPSHRYSEAQLAFHMKASLAAIASPPHD